MAVTRITDIIVPEIWVQYLRELTAENSRVFQSGAVATDPVIDQNINRGGNGVNIPFWKDLGSDGTTDTQQGDNPASSITAGAIEADEQFAPVLRRNVSFAAGDILAALAGSDPMQVAADRLAPFWDRRFNAVAISTISGALSALDSTSPSGSMLGYYDVAVASGTPVLLDADVVIDARQIGLGDASDQLTLMFVHSKVYAQLQKNNLIDFIPDARGEVTIPTYQGMTLIVTDTMPVQPESGDAAAVYDTFLVGPGALRYGEGTPKTPLEIERAAREASGAGVEYLVSRRDVVLHPLGFRYSGSLPIGGPDNDDLATGGNWTPVFERKNIPIVGIRTNG